MAAKSPPSVNNQWINLIGFFLGFGIAVYFIKISLSPITIILSAMTTYCFSIVLLECFFLKQPSLREFSSWREISLKRVFVKLIGLYVTFAVIIFLYWFFPEYKKPIYKDYFTLLKQVGPWISALAIPYFILMDAKTADHNDAYWKIGKIICFLPGKDYKGISQHCLGWLVKAFFLPLMFDNVPRLITYFTQTNFTHFFFDINLFYNSLFTALCAIDLLIAVIGYLFTLKLMDTNIRSTDSTFFGWGVCIVCYPPLNVSYLHLYFGYDSNPNFSLLAENPLLQWTWCLLCIGLFITYVLATIAFGNRFSNLTNRGIITQGMYRLTKHPAYCSKVTFWWLTALPTSILASAPKYWLITALSLAGVSLVYYYRAKTEEKHLSQDPAYVKYALWMNKHSIFAPISKYLTFLKYH